MKIKLNEEFYAEQKEHGFDLIQIRTVHKVDKMRKPTGETEEKHEPVAYNVSLDRCIKTAIHLGLQSKDDTVDFDGFLKAYRRELKQIDRMVQITK